MLDPSKSAAVPKTHLGEDSKGIISADRYVVYIRNRLLSYFLHIPCLDLNHNNEQHMKEYA